MSQKVVILTLFLLTIGILSGLFLRKIHITSEAAKLSQAAEIIDVSPAIEWKMFSGEYFSFLYPPSWNPKEVDNQSESSLYEVSLGIQDSDLLQKIEISPNLFYELEFENVIKSESLDIKARVWKYWIRKANDKVVYVFASENPLGSGSIVLKAESEIEDRVLFEELESVVRSITFVQNPEF